MKPKNILKVSLTLLCFLFILNQRLVSGRERKDRVSGRWLERTELENWQKKLKAWSQAKTVLEKTGETDPRIGIGFIELATWHKSTEHYERACELYYWGLSPAIFKNPK